MFLVHICMLKIFFNILVPLFVRFLSALARYVFMLPTAKRCNTLCMETLSSRLTCPLLFHIFLSTVLLVASKDCNLGVPMQFRTEGSIFNASRLNA